MSNLIRRDRLRRVMLLCAHFARNLAYYRAGHGRLTKTSPQFWITIDANFIDMAVIEWCKLLGDRKGKHFWANVVTDPSRFERAMLVHLGATEDEVAAYIEEMRTYRDKFLAHLDDLHVMDIPFLDRARAAVEFYHRYIVEHEAAVGGLVGLPDGFAGLLQSLFCRGQGDNRPPRSLRGDMNDSELGNKLVEREHLDLFLWSYEMNASPAKSSPTSWTTRRPISSPAMKQAMWSGLHKESKLGKSS